MKKIALIAALAAAAAASFASVPPDAASAPAATLVAQAGDKEAAASLAAQGWLVLLDRKDWGRAWETTGSVFRSKVPLGAWMDSIPKVRDPLGAMLERKPDRTEYKTSLHGQPDGEYVTVAFVTKFANKEVAEVVTTVLEPDGKWRVTGYLAR